MTSSTVDLTIKVCVCVSSGSIAALRVQYNGSVSTRATSVSNPLAYRYLVTASADSVAAYRINATCWARTACPVQSVAAILSVPSRVGQAANEVRYEQITDTSRTAFDHARAHARALWLTAVRTDGRTYERQRQSGCFPWRTDGNLSYNAKSNCQVRPLVNLLCRKCCRSVLSIHYVSENNVATQVRGKSDKQV